MWLASQHSFDARSMAPEHHEPPSDEQAPKVSRPIRRNRLQFARIVQSYAVIARSCGDLASALGSTAVAAAEQERHR